jgi:hypothetical protein
MKTTHDKSKSSSPVLGEAGSGFRPFQLGCFTKSRTRLGVYFLATQGILDYTRNGLVRVKFHRSCHNGRQPIPAMKAKGPGGSMNRRDAWQIFLLATPVPTKIVWRGL